MRDNTQNIFLFYRFGISRGRKGKDAKIKCAVDEIRRV